MGYVYLTLCDHVDYGSPDCSVFSPTGKTCKLYYSVVPSSHVQYMYLNLIQAGDSNSQQRMENFYYDFGLEIAFILFPKERQIYMLSKLFCGNYL